MPRKTGRDHTQYGLFATPLAAMIPPDAEVRVIAAFVDQLDLPTLGFKRVNKRGASAYGADVLLKIYLYGYLNRVRSSRRLARECRLNVELMWLTGSLSPCFKTIADFRATHPKALKQVFREYVLLLKEWGAIGGDRLAIDGTKIHGDNARKKNFTAPKLKRHLDRIDDRIDEALAEFERVDAFEDSAEKQEETARTQDALADLKARRKRYTDLQTQLEASDASQISLTDPDARALIKHGKESLVGYNIQSVVDAEQKLIVHVQATNENDINALGSLTAAAHELLDLDAGTEVLADKGYHNATELRAVRDLGHEPFVAERRQAGNNDKGTFPPSDFCYDDGHDAYVCPAGELLKSSGKLYQRKGSPSRFQTYRGSRKTCGQCPLRDRCLSAAARKKNGVRSVTRLEHAAAAEANRHNLLNNPGVYQQRQALVEHPFGTLKRHWTGYYTLLRGLDKVDGEYSLLACCYNLRRSVSIFGVLGLLERLGGRFSRVFAILELRSVVGAGVLAPYCEPLWWRRVGKLKTAGWG